MTTTTGKWTATDLEYASDVLLTADIGYWAVAQYDGGVLAVREQDGYGEGSGRITPASLLDWLATEQPLALIRALGDSYQRAAVASLMARDWENVDYDAETADVIVQAMILGGIVYG